MIDSDSQVPLDVLADEFATRIREGEQVDVEQYASRWPHLADEIRELFPAVQAMERLKRRQDDELGGRTTMPQRIGDFRVLREIGRGGMGIVYEAVQESLDRHVALKVLPRPSTWDERRLRRFRREARTAARLHHTNIVPVLGVGEEDGHHYIVMQYIRGVGLDEVIAALDLLLRKQADGGRPANRAISPRAHSLAQGLASSSAVGSDASTSDATADLVGGVATGLARLDSDAPSERHPDDTPTSDRPADLEPNGRLRKPPSHPGPSRRSPLWINIARLALQAAEALHYAHEQGTTHRDIKPGNLLLDEQGNVWVADFGLATVEHEGTHSSDVVGTLRYMAPEQLRGEADARSDIYSLGLSLYELLTLQPAFDDQQRRQSLLEGTPSPPPPLPRKVRSSVPRDLETVVLKATSPDPRRRYHSARELADDLQAFLQRRPIRARRVSPVERLAQWAGRNKQLAAAMSLAATLLVAIAVTASVAYWQTRESAAAAQRALNREKGQRQRAEATLETSLEALDRVYRRFAPDRMRDAASLAVPGGADWEVPPPPPPITPADAAMLEEILSVYDRFAEQQGDSERLLEESARANWRVAEIHRRLGDFQRAEAASRRAIAQYQRLGRLGQPRQAELSRVHNELGAVYLAQQRHQQAIQSHRAALDSLLPNGPPADWEQLPAPLRAEVARTDYLLTLADRDEPDRPSGLGRAVQLLETLNERDPGSGQYRHLLALCYLELEHDPFSPRTEEAVGLLDELVCDFPQTPDYRFDLIVACARGDMRSAFQRNRLEARLRQALLHSRQLVAGNPNVREYVQTHAHVLQRLGSLLTRKSDSLRDSQREEVMVEAEQLLREAAADQITLADRFPSEVAFRFYLANTQNMLGDLLLQAGKYEEAEEFCDRAIGQLFGQPATRSNHSMLAAAYGTLSLVHRAQGRAGLADDAAENAAYHRRQLRRGR